MMFGFYKKVRVNKKTVDKFLNCILSDTEGQSSGPISKTSWNTGGFVKTDLEFLFDQHLRNKIEKKVGKVDIIDLWYQTYNANSGSFHDWHIHPKSDYSITFYIQMKRDKSLFTQFRIGGKTKVAKASVGDCVIFNSSIVHRAPPNMTDTDKIIVSANLTKVK
tara:strand:+ start:150 stop:638 length:489 start_codon:yes stop_codon:yes gene_type:complete